jgi:uncharacterized protein YdhG (YjbR/CyaY superfamily)
MAKTDYRTIDDYLAAQPEQARKILTRVRRLVGDALPDGEETISYQMPAIRVAGRVAIYFAAWKDHWSIYPVREELLRQVGEDPAAHDQSRKGTVRFSLDAPIPETLVTRLAQAMGEDARSRAAAAKRRR